MRSCIFFFLFWLRDSKGNSPTEPHRWIARIVLHAVGETLAAAAKALGRYARRVAAAAAAVAASTDRVKTPAGRAREVGLSGAMFAPLRPTIQHDREDAGNMKCWQATNAADCL